SSPLINGSRATITATSLAATFVWRWRDSFTTSVDSRRPRRVDGDAEHPHCDTECCKRVGDARHEWSQDRGGERLPYPQRLTFAASLWSPRTSGEILQDVSNLERQLVPHKGSI